MTKHSPIHPRHMIRWRWLYLFLFLPTLIQLPVARIPIPAFSAIEIPVSLLVGPTLAISRDIPEPLVRHDEGFDTENLPHLNRAMDHPVLRDVNPAGAPEADRIPLPSRIIAVPPTGSTVLPSETETGRAEVQHSSVSPQGPESRFQEIIREAAQTHAVDPAIIMAIIKAESGYNPRAVSHRGAGGLMQLMPRTAESLGVQDIFCPKQNIHAGVKYFKQLLDEFEGNVRLALAAYNAGSRKVKKYKGVPPFRTTRLYIQKVFKYQKIYQQAVLETG